jgi:hypothetical protein
VVAATKSAAAATRRQSGSHKRSREEGSQGAAEAPATAPPGAAAAPAAAGTEKEEEWRPQWSLPREQRVAAGQRCKRLIDAARLRWLRAQGFDVALVKYVPSSVSGENRLLLAAAVAPAAL